MKQRQFNFSSEILLVSSK